MVKQHSSRFLALVNSVKNSIKEITPAQLKARLEQEPNLQVIDVREESEWRSGGHIPRAIHLGKGIIERDIEKIIPDTTTPIVVYCSGGFRCALVAESLQKMEYSQVSSLEGGMSAWVAAAYPLED